MHFSLKKLQVENTLQEENHWIKVIMPEPDHSKVVPYVGCNNCGKRTGLDCGASYNCKFFLKEKCVSTPK